MRAIRSTPWPSQLFDAPGGDPLTISFSWPVEKRAGRLKKLGFFRIIRDGEVVELERRALPQRRSPRHLRRPPGPRPGRPRAPGRFAGNPPSRTASAASPSAPRTATTSSSRTSSSARPAASRLEDPFPNLFSFNSPQGACPDCHGFGDLAVIDEDKIIPDRPRSLEDGAVEPWTKPVSRGMMKELLREARKRGSRPKSRTGAEARAPALHPRRRRRLAGGQGLFRLAPDPRNTRSRSASS